MNSYATLFLCINALLLLVVPRRWAPLPLLLCACYMTFAQGLMIGPFYFSVMRLLIAVGIIRVLIKREKPAGGWIRIDLALIIWAAWGIINSAFHDDPSDKFIFRLGWAYNLLGIYFLMRSFCGSRQDLFNIIRIIAIVLIPLAFEMLYEQVFRRNLFAFLGGVEYVPVIREGSVRSQGPFAHAILAGTIGAVSLPLISGIRRWVKPLSLMGMGACLGIVFFSSSSGPILSLMAALFALFLWRYRHLMKEIRAAFIFLYIALEVVMSAPAYYLMARIDLTGGSTGYHRARLIESAFEHLSEWWTTGTDYTRHWMPTGVSWSPDHVDITNYYLKLGVMGGLPLMLGFIYILWTAFRHVGEAVRTFEQTDPGFAYLAWALGASLFGHAATSISVSYFDQSVIFIYAGIALVVAARGISIQEFCQIRHQQAVTSPIEAKYA